MAKTKYQIIVEHLKNAIECNELKTGSKLPSVRDLSRTFHCSKDTAQKALTELRYQQYIYAKPKSGYYVLEQNQNHEDIELQLSQDRYQAYEDFRLCVNETLIGRDNYLFNYYSQQEGLEELRESVRQLLAEQTIYANLENIVLTSGTQQALYILSQIDFPNQKNQILVEQPTYHRMNQLLTNQNLAYRTIERNCEGIDLEKLEEIFRTGHIKFFYTIPRFHYPLGHSYHRKEKEAILKLANRYHVFIVEDDYLSDLDDKQELTFHYLDTSQHVIYIKSFSTSLFPALRITSLILPPSIRESFLQYKSIMDYDSNLIMQKSLSLYINNGMYGKNRLDRLKKMREQQKEIQNDYAGLGLELKVHYLPNALLLELDDSIQLPALKHSNIPLDFFEQAYLSSCPYQFAKLDYEIAKKYLPQIQLYIKKD
ncbi:putative transcriptional regulator of pyridoxine metabolism [Streptococcus sp. DD10]|uniref:aminotransferase-like domain-containing protein n=1 Tax=Streptococcus sp. DD10 TaxID=1777878 RepID=UPI000792C3EC|nr:putative transcriptional regulator of pyridoxine metabolism [Streptococcus sp. DD10]